MLGRAQENLTFKESKRDIIQIQVFEEERLRRYKKEIRDVRATLKDFNREDGRYTYLPLTWLDKRTIGTTKLYSIEKQANEIKPAKLLRLNLGIQYMKVADHLYKRIKNRPIEVILADTKLSQDRLSVIVINDVNVDVVDDSTGQSIVLKLRQGMILSITEHTEIINEETEEYEIYQTISMGTGINQIQVSGIISIDSEEPVRKQISTINVIEMDRLNEALKNFVVGTNIAAIYAGSRGRVTQAIGIELVKENIIIINDTLNNRITINDVEFTMSEFKRALEDKLKIVEII